MSTYLVYGQLISGETISINAASEEAAQAALAKMSARPDVVNAQWKMTSAREPSTLEQLPGESLVEYIDRLRETASRLPNSVAGRQEAADLRDQADELELKLGS